MKSPFDWIADAKWSACGASASSSSDWRAWKKGFARAGPGFFPPELVVQIKALACELPSAHQQPLSRWSVSDLSRYAQSCGLVATISDSTIWRWLNQDAIRPWRYRSWIFPRDPLFAPKAGRVLDLYHHIWDGQPLCEEDFVLSADEKTSIQARRRKHLSYPPQPDSVMKIEHEYTRCGAWAYLAAIDVHRAKLFGRCEARNGIASFDRLVEQVMTQAPYRTAKRVFWILDNGSSHRGQRCVTRLQGRYPNLIVVHAPVHASWLNQIEIYFSILQRKLLTPNDFKSLKVLELNLMEFQRYYEQIAKPFEWKFTRQDLTSMLNKLKSASLTTERLAA